MSRTVPKWLKHYKIRKYRTFTRFLDDYKNINDIPRKIETQEKFPEGSTNYY